LLFTMDERILILAPHEDDEALMCSGIITHALANAADIKVVVATNGDNKGRKKGINRMRETIKAMECLGLSRAKIIFLGYGNIKQGKGRFLSLLYDAETDNTLIPSRVGTESYSIPEIPEYHYLKYGVHAHYDRATFRQDLESVIQEFNPNHIFVSSLYDMHPDHVALYRFTVEGIINIKRHDPNFSPVLHEYLIHPHKTDDYWLICEHNNSPRSSSSKSEVVEIGTVMDDFWPVREHKKNPLVPFSKPEAFEARTVLNWDEREIFPLPLAMQNSPRSKNRKYLAISKYRSQRPKGNNNYLYSYVKFDEFFWKKDFSNIAILATVSVSSESVITGQLGIKAIDGITDGSPRFPVNEWVTMGETAGAWIQLSWPQVHMVNKIVLFDRPNPQDNINGATLTFSDGSSIQVGTLPDNGSGYEINFAAKKIQWVKLTVDTASGENVGLSEFEVYEAAEIDKDNELEALK
jgi:LmbE family N-acetylglucosaminyl deacetylase